MWKKCFLSDGSLFYEDPIWILDNLQIFHEHFVIKADESKDKKFLEKLLYVFVPRYCVFIIFFQASQTYQVKRNALLLVQYCRGAMSQFLKIISY